MASNKMAGCGFGKVSRNMIENIEKEHNDFKSYIVGEFLELKNTNKTLYNHLSRRLPIWATILFTILGSLVTGLIVTAVIN